MATKVYCVQLYPQTDGGPLPPVIRIRADSFRSPNERTHDFKIGDEIVARVNDRIRAWWIDHLEE